MIISAVGWERKKKRRPRALVLKDDGGNHVHSRQSANRDGSRMRNTSYFIVNTL
jgi:hypothetical protein